ncbi:DNA-processing protein DprA [Vagococcus salmoninarum]|uniref:DNA protecting protein DprA n=2 Tax=Vagococcus salmoninarum TaxID=2739 RepID=A0A429ZNW8_9ENTE|nr:DNA-processing protein DprA [Vagococcus salmoninarum]MBE9387967.1 DNA-protecting protein DprA [Vagococcus salmoninarum]RST95392.1 DNA protecting protein DprA [Vagococcus salmoninarum]
MNLKTFIYHLKHTQGISNLSLLKIIEHCLTTAQTELTFAELAALVKIPQEKRQLVEASLYDSQANGVELSSDCGMVTIIDQDYPEPLKEVYNPPAALFYQGNIQLLKEPSIAIVGSRKMTDYGKRVIGSLVPSLVAHNLTIVSGLARGVDTYAHQQTIYQKGKTIGIIGSGLNVTYPQENFRLQDYLGKAHLLVSEYSRDSPPKPYHFPARNRIIAGITAGTCIIEAKESSGSLITAQLALEAGREVFAVPGDIHSEESIGPIQLIQQGAKCVRKAQDILEEYPFNCKDFMN